MDKKIRNTIHNVVWESLLEMETTEIHKVTQKYVQDCVNNVTCNILGSEINDRLTMDKQTLSIKIYSKWVKCHKMFHDMGIL